MKMLFIIFFAAITILQLSCEHSLIGPEPPLKDPRTYVWTVDTLYYSGSIQTIMRDIWGSSPRDMYVVGHNAGPSWDVGDMYHYDGKVWRPVRLPFGHISVEAIHGFASSDIWVVGELLYQNPSPPPNFLDSSFVIHYDGGHWREVKLVKPRRSLTSIWGRSPNDIWMGGFDGTLYHYDGVSVKRDSVPFAFPKTLNLDSYNFTTIAGSSEVVHLLLAVGKAAEYYRARLYFFEHRMNSWALTDSLFDISIGQLWMSPSNILYRAGFGVYKRLGNSWQSLQLDVLSASSISGFSDDNFFVAGFSGGSDGLLGQVYHYNGTNWFQFKQLQLPDVIYTDIWTDGREVFAVGYTLGSYPQKTVIVHGK